MKYKSFSCEINEEFTKELSEFLSQDGDKTIYLNTHGGQYSEAMTAVHMINSQKENVTLVGVSGLFSAGFRIFHDVKCKKELAPGCTGMIHQPNIKVDLDGNGKLDNSSDKHRAEMNKLCWKLTKKIAKNLKFNKKEMKKLHKNYYVYFNHKRMKELFNV